MVLAELKMELLELGRNSSDPKFTGILEDLTFDQFLLVCVRSYDIVRLHKHRDTVHKHTNPITLRQSCNNEIIQWSKKSL